MHLPSQKPLLKDKQVGYSGHPKVFWLKEHNAVYLQTHPIPTSALWFPLLPVILAL